MSKGINKVILIGNLGADPEANGAVVKIKLATSESWRDKQTGQTSERTEWHKVAFFGRLGEIAQQYLRKGSKVYVEGSIRTSKYQGKDGTEKYSTEIIASTLQMLDSKTNEHAPKYEYMPATPQGPVSYANTEELDDLPF